MSGGRLIFPATDPCLTNQNLLNVGATLTVYQTGTNVLASIFADIGLTTPILNPQTSNSAGRFYAQSTQICADTGAGYDIVLAFTDGESFTYTDVYPLGAAPNLSGFLQNPNVNLTGVPTAPTAAVNNASSQIATTQFVANAIAAAAAAFLAPGTEITSAAPLTLSGWYLENGQAISRSGNPTLFAAYGIAFGAGDGSTTFNIPNMQGNFPRGANPSGTGPGPTTTTGTVLADQLQGFTVLGGVSQNNSGISTYGVTTTGVPGSATGCATQNAGGTTYQNKTSGPVTDGTNGTPRLGLETRPAFVTKYWYVKGG